MSLSKRLEQVTPNRGPTDCITCAWLEQQPVGDQEAFWGWVDQGQSPKQLWNECAAEGLVVSETAFSRHIRNHRDRYALHSDVVKRAAS